MPLSLRYCCAGLLLLPLWLHSQPDTLLQRLSAIADPAMRIDSMLHESRRLRRKQPETAYQLASRSLQDALAAGDLPRRVDAQITLAEYTKDRKQLEAAFPLIREARETAKRSQLQALYFDATRILADLHSESTRADSALYYFLLSEREALDAGLPYQAMYAYIGIGELYFLQHEEDKGIVYFHKALEIARARKVRKDYGYLLYVLIEYYQGIRDLENYSRYAEEYLAFQAERKTPISPSDVAHFALVTAHETQDPLQRIQLLRDGIAVHERLGNYRILAEVYFQLGKLYGELGRWAEATECFAAGAKVDERLGMVMHRIEFLRLAYASSRNAGKLEAALEFLEQYNVLADSVRDEQANQRFRELEVRYETEKKEQMIQIQQLELAQSARMRWILLGGLAAILAVAGAVSFALIQQHRHNRVLSAKNAEIAASLQQRELLLREIHHRVKNNLQMISSLLRLQTRFMEDPEAVRAIHEGRNRVRSMALIHENLYQHTDLTTVGMQDYVRKLVDSLAASYNIRPEHIQFHTEVEDMALDVDTVIPLGLILHELVANVCKHAFPDGSSGSVRIRFGRAAGGLQLLVQDNGTGMAAPAGRGSFGLELIRTLTQQLGGVLRIDGQTGTTVELLFPEPQPDRAPATI